MIGSSGSAAYLGREEQLERLDGLLDAAADGHAGYALISGPAGAGVTSTARQVASRAAALGFNVLWGACRRGLGTRPFDALAEALEERSRATEAVELRAELGDGAPPLARVAPALRVPLPGIPPAAPLEPRDEVARLRDATLSWLLRLAQAAPTLLVVDDLQWADEDLFGLLDHLAARSVGQRLLLLGGWSNDEASDGSAPPGGAYVIDLPGLDEGATRTLLAREWEGHTPVETARLIHHASGGHPLAARELHRHLREEGHIGRPGQASLPPAEALPGSLDEIIAWRLAALSLEERTALGALACFPGPAAPAAVAAVAGMSRPRAAEALERSVPRGFVSPTRAGGAYELAHPRLGQAIRGGLSAPLRARALGHVAEVIELELGADGRGQAAVLLELWAAALLAPESAATDIADRSRAAVRYGLVAAEQSRAAAAYRRAARCLELALQLADAGRQPLRDELRLRLAVALAEADLPARALAIVLESIPRRLEHDQAELLVDAVRALLEHDRRAEADQLRAALAAHTARWPAELSARLALYGGTWQPIERGEIRGLIWQSDPAAEAAARESSDERDLAELFAPQRVRTHEQTVSLLIRARGWRRPASLLRALHGATVDLSSRLGHSRQALSWAGEYVAAAARFGSPLDQLRAAMLLAECQAVVGDFAAAGEALAAADEVGSRLPPEQRMASERLLAELVVAHYRDGDWPALARQAAERGAEGGRSALLLGAEAALGHVRAGDAGRASQMFDDIIALVQDWPPLTYLRDSALMAGLAAAWESGWAQHAALSRTLADQAAAAGAGGGHAATPGLARARADALAGRLDEARARFAAERELLGETGRRPLLAILEHDEAVALAAAGEQHYAAAGALLERSADAFAELGMEGWQARARSLLGVGFERAAQPGGRLHFSYPLGLSRREADLVRLVAGGASAEEAAATLELAPEIGQRHLDSALAKLGTDQLSELPRLARQHGLGGA